MMMMMMMTSTSSTTTTSSSPSSCSSSSSSSSSFTLRIGHLGRKVSTATVRRAVQRAQQDPNVRSIVFLEIDFAKLVDDVQALCWNRRGLQSLRFIGCTHMTAILTAVCDSTVTRSLVVSGPVVEAEALRALNTGLRTNQSIQTLKLLGINFVEASCVQHNNNNNTSDDNNNDNNTHHLASSSSSSLLSGLTRNATVRHLDLSRCHFSSSQRLGVTLRACSKTLESLNLCDCRLEDETLAEIVNLVGTQSLRSLNMAHNAVHVHTLQALTQLLASSSSSSSPTCALQSLNLSHGVAVVNVQGNTRCFTEALRGTLNALQHNTSLQTLDVSGNAAIWQDVTAVRALMTAVSKHTTLQSLDLSHAGLTADGMAVVAEFLPRLSQYRLKELHVLSSGNNHRDDAVVTMYDLLWQGLQHNTTLTSLGDDDDDDDDDDEDDNNYNNNTNTTITKRTQQQLAVAHTLTMNAAGRRALTATHLPLSMWSRVLARAAAMEDDTQRHDGLFGLLQQGPALWER
mmetsp:Transcript_926/g.1926  ORF Transcript_926/g.1926 Transcript_926/m.1926 type:complete len:514 (-) Transcript_926:163-1704(-)